MLNAQATNVMTSDSRIDRLKELITGHPDFPKPGICFRDFFPVLRDAEAFGDLIDIMVEQINLKSLEVDVVIGLESRGFLIGPSIAQRLNAGFVPIRKKGKLPGELLKITYELEYGEDTFEIQKDSVKPGQKVVIVDDLLATGGTMAASVELIESLQAQVVLCQVVIELPDLKGREKLKVPFVSLVKY